MGEKKRRVRTGCWTCRARHVKCDEQAPECRRCTAANIKCAGYQRRRVIASAQPHYNRQSGQMSSPERLSSHAHESQVSEPSPEPQGFVSLGDHQQSAFPASNLTPPRGLLSCPRLDQRPGLGARHVLGYNQVLIRTVPLLFEPEHLHFWRDEIFQEAWGVEYLYLTLVSLGNLHRAMLATTSKEGCHVMNGMEMKIIAVQMYTQALEELSTNLQEAKGNPALLVAGLCLMAYFEAFSGNIPAFIGRCRAAEHYFQTLIIPSTCRNAAGVVQFGALAPLEDCLRSLRQTSYITLPLRWMHSSTEKHLGSSAWTHLSPAVRTDTTLGALQSLLDLVSDHPEVNELIWAPIAAYARQTSIQTIQDFDGKLQEWRIRYLHLIPELNSDAALGSLLVYKWQKYAMPPPAHTSTTPNASLAAAHYNFYKARLRWALALLGDHLEHNQLSADFYFYEALRHAASHALRLGSGDQGQGLYIPCEALRVGLLPVLHITGLCSPQSEWLEWIKELCGQIVQEGVLKGHTFATNLDCLHRMEFRRHSAASASPMVRYPSPSERIICQLIPDTDGRHFTSFFAAPSLDPGLHCDGLAAYRVIGYAWWKCGGGESPCTPVMTMYEGLSSTLDDFSMEWLFNTQPSLKWRSWSSEKEFCMDSALRDHISGTRMLVGAEEGSLSTSGG